GRFELGKVDTMEIRHRMVHEFFNRINHELAVRIAQGVGVEPPAAFAGQETDKRIPEVSVIKRGRYDTIATRKVAILLADGFDHGQFMAVKEMLMDGGAKPKVVAKMQGTLASANGEKVEVDESYLTTASVLCDAFFVPGGAASVEALKEQGDALHFIQEGFRHAKPIGATGEGVDLLAEARLPGIDLSDGGVTSDKGVVTARDGADGFADAFKDAVAKW